MRTVEQLSILCVLAALLLFCSCRKCDELHKTTKHSFYRVPSDIKTITEALRRANDDDGIYIEAGRYSEETGEELPLRITRKISIDAQRGAELIVDGTKHTTAISIEGEYTSIQGLSIIQKDGNSVVGIESSANSCAIQGCLLVTNVGVRSTRGFALINRNLFYKHVADSLPSIGIEIRSASARIGNNTIVGFETNVLLSNITDSLDFSENIIVRGGIGVALDQKTLDRGTEWIYRNDVWGNTVADWYNADTKTALPTPVSPYGPNISADPVFIDQVNDLRIHASSPAAAVVIPEPKPKWVPDTVSIGAFETAYYRTALVLGLSSNSPQGFLPRAPETEVLRFTATAASTADVVLKSPFGVGFRIVSNGKTATWPTNIAIVETISRQPIMSSTVTPSPNSAGEVHFNLTHGAGIPAGTTVTYSVLIDTSAFQPGEGVRFTLIRLDWSDGVIPRIYDGKTQQIEGHALSF